MSRLSKQLEAHQTGRRYGGFEVRFVEVKDSVPTRCGLPDLYEYNVECTVKAKVRAGNAQDLVYRKDIARKQIIEEIFGEFRKPLYDLKGAIWDRDYRRADKIAGEIFTRMFEE